MAKVKWGEKRYYSSYRDNSFMHTKVLKEKKISASYRYLPRSFFVRFLQWLFYYVIAVPILWVFCKIKFGIKVRGKEKIKKLRKQKTGAILIGNHSHPGDCVFASVFVAAPTRNYFVANKDAVQVVVAKHFTKALGALPLPDDPKGLASLAAAVDTLVKKGKFVTIYPEACIWPYYNKLRPLPPAAFGYAVRSNVPVVPFAVTYSKRKGKNAMKKKPRVNITILDPIYPDQSASVVDAREQLASQTTAALKAVVESEDNVEFISYRPISELKEKENGKDNS